MWELPTFLRQTKVRAAAATSGRIDFPTSIKDVSTLHPPSLLVQFG